MKPTVGTMRNLVATWLPWAGWLVALYLLMDLALEPSNGMSASRRAMMQPKVPVPDPNRAPGVFKHYYYANSTVPGAGLGVFAKDDLPAGTFWNYEDSAAHMTLNITEPQFKALLNLVQAIRDAGYPNHLLTKFLEVWQRYAYYCEDEDIYIVSLTPSILTNHAPLPVEDGEGTDTPSRTANSYYAVWSSISKVDPVMAASMTSRQSCTMSRTFKPIQRGGEILEDYSSYECPWAECPHPKVEWYNGKRQQFRPS